jgi:hypothetical protein
MFYVRLGERQENTTGRTPSKPHLFNTHALFIGRSRNKNEIKNQFKIFDSTKIIFILNKSLNTGIVYIF